MRDHQWFNLLYLRVVVLFNRSDDPKATPFQGALPFSLDVSKIMYQMAEVWSKICEVGYSHPNEEKINVWRANKQLNGLHTAVLVANSYLLHCRVKTGGKLLLFIVLQRIKKKGEELRTKPIGNWNKKMLVKSENKLEESGEIRSNESFPRNSEIAGNDIIMIFMGMICFKEV